MSCLDFLEEKIHAKNARLKIFPLVINIVAVVVVIFVFSVKAKKGKKAEGGKEKKSDDKAAK